MAIQEASTLCQLMMALFERDVDNDLRSNMIECRCESEFTTGKYLICKPRLLDSVQQNSECKAQFFGEQTCVSDPSKIG